MGTLFDISHSTGVADFKEKGTLNFVLEQGASSPVSGVEGHLFWRTDTKQPLIHDGTDYKAILGGSFRVYNETPSGTVDGVNTVFATANPYVTGTTIVTRDGLVMKPTVDYTETLPATGTITFTTAPSGGSIILVSYSRVEGSSLPIMNKFDVVVGTPKQTYTGSTTVFDLPFAFTQGVGSLLVYSAGVLMLVGASNDYQETTQAEITFNSARTVGEVIQFIKIGATNDQVTSGWVDGGTYVTLSGPTDQVRIGNGSAATPALSFINDTDTGIFGLADNSIRLTLGGTQRFIFDANAIYVPDGAAATPSYTFSSDTNTGMYSGGADTLALTANGTKVVTISGSALASNKRAIMYLNDSANELGTSLFIGFGERTLSYSGSESGWLDLSKGDAAGTYLGAHNQIRLLAGANVQASTSYTSKDNTGRYFVLSPNPFSDDSQPIPGRTFTIGANTYTVRQYRNANSRLFVYEDISGEAASGTLTNVNYATTSMMAAANQTRVQDGSVASPSISFLNHTSSGIAYATGVQIVASGVNVLAAFSNGAQAFLRPGDISNPSMAFQAEAGLGIFNPTLHNLAVTSNGAERWRVSDSSSIFSVPAYFPDGSSSAPSISFGNQTNTGLFRSSTTIGFSAGGTEYLRVSTSGGGQVLLTNGSHIEMGDGAAATPVLTFNADTDTGLFRQAAGRMSFTSNGFETVRMGTSSSADGVVHSPIEMIFGGNGCNASLTAQTTTGVTTSGSYIHGINFGLVLVTGNDNTNYFLDLLLTSYNSGTPVTIASKTHQGTPAARTYNSDGTGLKLTMASGTYKIVAVALDSSVR